MVSSDFLNMHGTFLAIKIVTWNSMIARDTKHGHFDDVFGCLNSMGHDGIFPNPISFLYCIKACSSIGPLDRCLGFILRNDLIRIPSLEAL